MTIVCPHHGVQPNGSWTPYRVMGRLSIVYRFDCCEFTMQVNGLPVPGVHEPLPDDGAPCDLTHRLDVL